MSPSPARIVVEDLRKSYRVATHPPGTRAGLAAWLPSRRHWRTIAALRGVTFTIEPGTITGLIGPNGAGKSTVIKILSGILRPESGRVTVGGPGAVGPAAPPCRAHRRGVRPALAALVGPAGR
ncbi:ATP-binding cassette domain-containing protein [Gluconacetobacter asukensis]|uniref:ATP-binding cassette domain-containing protein n=1 Tax=Gluconacetobacter asukensis TaxID=1017181 RepID=UPI0023DDF79B|nr:ATP-binding cassette domain-containing protein [Gluconacetobacter asukensis]